MRFTSRLSPVTSLPLVTFVVSAWMTAVLFYRDLPSRVPTHWSVPFHADGYTPKPWGPFEFPLIMTIVWFARPLIRHLSFSRNRQERFPGAFDFRIMLTIGLLFVIWTLIVAQSVFWLRAVAIPTSVALIVGGRFLGRLPFRAVDGPGTAEFLSREDEWQRTRRFAGALFVIAGVMIFLFAAIGR